MDDPTTVGNVEANKKRTYTYTYVYDHTNPNNWILKSIREEHPRIVKEKKNKENIPESTMDKSDTGKYVFC